MHSTSAARPLRVLSTAVVTAAALASPAAAQGWTYEGNGFHAPTATGLSASRVEVVDIDHDGHQDLLALESDGALTANFELVARQDTYRLADVAGVAVTRAGGERVWAVRGRELVEITMSDLAAKTTPAPVGIAATGFVDLIAQDRQGGPRLLLIDQGGARLRVLAQHSEDRWATIMTRFATVGGGPIRDAALVDWVGDGTDWLATINDLGLDVYDDRGTAQLSLPGDPTGAFVDTLPGHTAPYGRDLLVYHHRETPSQPEVVWLANADHDEAHSVSGMNVSQVLLGDFLPSNSVELCVASGAQRDLWILASKRNPNPASAYFFFDLNSVFHANLDVGSGAPISAAPIGVFADVEGDGDVDLVFVDDQGRKVVLTSDIEDEELLRVGSYETFPQVYGSPSKYHGEIEAFYLPPGCSQFEIEVVRYKPGRSGTTVFGPQMMSLGMTQFEFPDVQEPDVIYQYVLRAIDDAGSVVYPARVGAFSNTLPVMEEIIQKASQSYAWSAGLLAPPGETGGTTRKPIIDPPPPLGP